MAAGAGTKAIANAVEGKDLTDGMMQQALISGITGGVASGASQSLGRVVGNATSTIGKIAL